MSCRNEKKAETAKHDVATRSGIDLTKIHICQLDLADLDNIGTFRSRYDVLPGLANRPVDMLILNAGVMAMPKREVTKQGLEAQTGTNVVGHFKFAAVMFDLCKQAEHCRIVSVSSLMHKMAWGVNIEDFNREKKYNAWSVYDETKLCNLLFMAKLNRLLEEKGVNNVLVVGCHP
jgi:NAD(P)-dependent dehydrogenase (short-subunit alcohol dehydrogenase family)